MPDSTWISSQNQPGSSNGDILREWISKNRKSIIATFIILIAVLIIVIMVFVNINKNRDTAEKYFFIAQQYYYAQNYEKALENIEVIEKNYSNYPTYDFALFLKGDIYYSQSNYAKAIEIYEDAIKKLKNRDLIPFALYSLSKSYQAVGDYKTAILKFNQFIESYPDHYLTPDVYLSAALSYEKLNQKDLAKETYQKVSVLFPNTSWQGIANEALKRYKK